MNQKSTLPLEFTPEVIECAKEQMLFPKVFWSEVRAALAEELKAGKSFKVLAFVDRFLSARSPQEVPGDEAELYRQATRYTVYACVLRSVEPERTPEEALEHLAEFSRYHDAMPEGGEAR